MFLPAPLFSLLVLSFRVLPTHQSERSCHNRVGCRGKWRRAELKCVEDLQPRLGVVVCLA